MGYLTFSASASIFAMAFNDLSSVADGYKREYNSAAEDAVSFTIDADVTHSINSALVPRTKCAYVGSLLSCLW